MIIRDANKFMVRRKRHLEMMYTDGLRFWTEKVERSEANHPYSLYDIILSPDNNTLLAYCHTTGNDKDAAFYA